MKDQLEEGVWLLIGVPISLLFWISASLNSSAPFWTWPLLWGFYTASNMIHFAVFVSKVATHCEHNDHKDQTQGCTNAQCNKQEDIFDYFCKEGQKKWKRSESEVRAITIIVMIL